MTEPIEGCRPGFSNCVRPASSAGPTTRDVLEPALREGVDSGELRVMFILTAFDGLEPGVWFEDMKTGMNTWMRDHSAWERIALVTDIEWVGQGHTPFSPG
jgi:SpoIIAA-like